MSRRSGKPPSPGSWYVTLATRHLCFSSRPCCFFDAKPRLMCLGRVTVGEPGIWTGGSSGPVVSFLFRKGWDERDSTFHSRDHAPSSRPVGYPRMSSTECLLSCPRSLLEAGWTLAGISWRRVPFAGWQLATSADASPSKPCIGVRRSASTYTGKSPLRDIRPPCAFTDAGNAPRDRPGYHNLWH